MNNIVQVKEVIKDYLLGKVKVPALRKLNLDVKTGEFLCIMGPSGSGKTTLFNLIGLLDQPSGGEIWINQTATHRFNYAEAAKFRSQFIGFIFQSFNLFPVLTAFENIEYPLLFLPLSKKERRDRVWQALTDVQLREVALHRPDELSGGQRQRVAIARAIVTQPRLIIADEPTANLDSESTEAVMSVMQRLNQKNNTTFLFSTHDPRVTHHATRILVLRDGVIHNDEHTQKNVTHLMEKRLSQ